MEPPRVALEGAEVDVVDEGVVTLVLVVDVSAPAGATDARDSPTRPTRPTTTGPHREGRELPERPTVSVGFNMVGSFGEGPPQRTKVGTVEGSWFGAHGAS
jgi:hypothetical protein